MRRRCDRCGKRRGWLKVEGDWRLFCGRCLLAAAWEPAQPRPTRTAVARSVGVTDETRAAHRALVAGQISAEQYVHIVKRVVNRRVRRAANSQKGPSDA